MDIERRELGQDRHGDTWRLVFDRPNGHLSLERERAEPEAIGPGAPAHTVRSLTLAQLRESGPPEIDAEVERLLAPMFPTPPAW